MKSLIMQNNLDYPYLGMTYLGNIKYLSSSYSID